MNKKVGLYNFKNTDAIEKYFIGKNIEFTVLGNIENSENFDLVVTKDCIENICDNAINIHPSLLPAYPVKDAIAKAFSDGVKVSGITIHSKDKIIAQYPVLISLETHVDDFIKDLNDVENKLLPPVIDSILNDRVFDFSDLFSNLCNNGRCSGCNGCH